MARHLSVIRNVVALLRIQYIALVLACVAVVLLANEDPFARDILCHKGLCFWSEAARFWNKLLYDIACGCLITTVFYWLLGRYPEYRKRTRIRNNLLTQYRSFKLKCIENFLAVADGGFDSELPEALLQCEMFRDYFNENVSDGKTRWDEVANNMTRYYLSATLSRMEFLRQEILFAMNSTDISDRETLDQLKGLSEVAFMQRDATIDYDSIGSLLGLFWKLFAGWDPIEGYRSEDIIEEAINRI